MPSILTCILGRLWLFCACSPCNQLWRGTWCKLELIHWHMELQVQRSSSPMIRALDKHSSPYEKLSPFHPLWCSYDERNEGGNALRHSTAWLPEHRRKTKTPSPTCKKSISNFPLVQVFPTHLIASHDQQYLLWISFLSVIFSFDCVCCINFVNSLSGAKCLGTAPVCAFMPNSSFLKSKLFHQRTIYAHSGYFWRT